MQYCVCFYTYSGMPIPIVPAYAPVDLDEARRVVARMLRYRRNSGHFVTKLRPQAGEVARWEAQEPADAGWVPDTAGILVLEAINTSNEREYDNE